MDELEKRLFEKYGTRTISPEEIQEILVEASKRGLIEKKDIRPQPPMDATSLMEHISHLRRLFLINDGFSLELSGDESRESLYDGGGAKNGPARNEENKDKVMDKVLRAYFEYERSTHTIQNKRRKVVILPSVALVLLTALFFLYTPEPY